MNKCTSYSRELLITDGCAVTHSRAALAAAASPAALPAAGILSLALVWLSSVPLLCVAMRRRGSAAGCGLAGLLVGGGSNPHAGAALQEATQKATQSESEADWLRFAAQS